MWEPCRVGDPTRHGDLPMRHGALVLLSFGRIRTIWARATSRWRLNATWRPPNATWPARFPLFWADSVPWSSCHVVLEVQRDMATSQCDVARSFCPLLGGFGPFGFEPRRVGGPTRHGDLPMRHGTLVLLSFGRIRTLEARATSRWRPIATWRTPNATWRTRFALFRGDSDPWSSCHVVLEAHRDMAHFQCDVARSFSSILGEFGPLGLVPRRVEGPSRHGDLPMRRGALVFLYFGRIRTLWARATSCWRPIATWRIPNATWRTFVWSLQQKSHLRAKSEVAGLFLI